MNTPSESRRCPECLAEIPAGAPQGLCPKCLLLQVAAAGAQDDSVSKPSSPSATRQEPGSGRRSERPVPPTVADLASAFPQLEILELIGRGGMGFVYKARQTKLDRIVALKILPGHLADEPSFRERFEREARVLAKLHHPLIVGVYDFGEAVVQQASGSGSARPVFYLVLEYVDGVNLREAMRAGRFTPEQALSIVPQVCEALQYAHSKGVLHRDIKPENILLSTDGKVKIADFGIAKFLGPDGSSQVAAVPTGASESEIAVTRLTATGSILGTPLYMAPEQLINPNSVDHRADIYSLGVVFYEMLTGELPMGRFAVPSEKSLVDQRIDEVVLRALAKERELRQQSADEMKSQVETIASHPGHRQNPVIEPAAARSSDVAAPSVAASGWNGWWALASLFLVIPVALSWTVGIRVASTTSQPEPSSVAILPLLMLSFLVIAALGVPPWLGWRHLLRQRHNRQSEGVIPALLATWFLPLVMLDSLIFALTIYPLDEIARSSDRKQVVLVVGRYVAAFLCLLADGAILVASWHWATRTPFRSNTASRIGDADQSTYRIWGMVLVVLSIAFTVGWGIFVSLDNRRVSEEWFLSITAAQQEWQRANGRLNLLETDWKHRKKTVEPTLPDDQQQKERKRLESELEAYNKERARLKEQIATLDGQMQVLSVMGHYRTGMTAFLPLALFAVPLGITGLMLLFRRHRLWIASLMAGGSITAIFVGSIFLQENSQATLVPNRTPADSAVSEPAGVNDFNGTANVNAGSFARPDRPAIIGEQKVRTLCAAEQEAEKLKLVQAFRMSGGRFQANQVVLLQGDHGEVRVEQFYSGLVRLPEPTSFVTFFLQTSEGYREERKYRSESPIDYLACDRSAGGDSVMMIGYVLPPGAYDLRGDTETGERLKLASRTDIATRVLKMAAESKANLPSTETEWQQAKQGRYLCFKLAKGDFSNPMTPDEYLVNIGEDSQSVLSRSRQQFTRHDLGSQAPIRSLRELIREISPPNDQIELPPQLPAESGEAPADALNPANQIPKKLPE